jgi:hypothetical protein
MMPAREPETLLARISQRHFNAGSGKDSRECFTSVGVVVDDENSHNDLKHDLTIEMAKTYTINVDHTLGAARDVSGRQRMSW